MKPTADLSDDSGGALPVCATQFRNVGGVAKFHGPISTVLCDRDNSLVREALEQPGDGRVLVVDGGGALDTALVGDNLALLAVQNGWRGIVVHAAVRDIDGLAVIPVGVKTLGSNPRRSAKRGAGERDVPVSFGGVTFNPGDHLYSDNDGIVLDPSR